MAKRNAAVINDGDSPPLRVEKAAGNVSESLDKVIHERMRLGIISALAANEKLSFTDLKNLLNTTDGNVSVHARKLEDAGYVVC
ncbi:MAG TPA: transcriptional regulator, partial [Pyrinomonadaceae bacterium]